MTCSQSRSVTTVRVLEAHLPVAAASRDSSWHFPDDSPMDYWHRVTLSYGSSWPTSLSHSHRNPFIVLSYCAVELATCIGVREGASIFHQALPAPTPPSLGLTRTFSISFQFPPFSRFHSPHLPKNQLLGSLEPGAKRTNYCVFYAGKSRLVTFIRLLTFHLDSFVGSTNALDPTDFKSGRVRTQGPGGNRRLCVRGIFAFDLCASAATRMPYVQCLTSRKRDWA